MIRSLVYLLGMSGGAVIALCLFFWRLVRECF